MRHRSGAHRQRPSLAARLPLYALVLSLQLSAGASLMTGGGATDVPAVAAAHGEAQAPLSPAPDQDVPAPVEAPPAPAAEPAPSPVPVPTVRTPAPTLLTTPSVDRHVPVPTAASTPALESPAPAAKSPNKPVTAGERLAAAARLRAAAGTPGKPAVRVPPARKMPAAKARVAKPAVRKPAVRKPAVRKPAVRKPAVRKPALRTPAVKRPAAKRPAARKPAPRPAAKKPVAKRPAAKKPVAKRPAAKKPGAKKPLPKKQAGKAKRWLPTGLGMWTNNWAKTSDGNPRRVVRTALQQKVTHIFVKTGTLKGGFDGGPVLARLLPATRGTNIKIIAWDFPMLRDPLADAARLAAAAKFSAGPGMPRVAAVAPDIETRAEGTRLTTGAVVVYYRELRRLLPADVAILATVPWPSEKRVGKYPYAVTAQFADAFVPMAYWFNRSPVAVTQQSIRYLERFGRPVMPAGMAYDPDMDAPGLGLSTPKASELAAFATASRRAGATAISFWAWQTASPDHWRGIRASALGFPARPAPHPAVPVDTSTSVAIPLGVQSSGGPFDRPF